MDSGFLPSRNLHSHGDTDHKQTSTGSRPFQKVMIITVEGEIMCCGKGTVILASVVREDLSEEAAPAL